MESDNSACERLPSLLLESLPSDLYLILALDHQDVKEVTAARFDVNRDLLAIEHHTQSDDRHMCMHPKGRKHVAEGASASYRPHHPPAWVQAAAESVVGATRNDEGNAVEDSSP